MNQRVISDGAFFASGTFVCQRALVRKEGDHETEVSPKRTICEVAEGVFDRTGQAQRIACALNAQFNMGEPA